MKLLKWAEAKEEIKTGKVFLEFTTSWCGDCKMMEPVVSNVEATIKEKNINDVKFIKVDAEEANLFRDSNSDFEVLKVPSFFVINEGIKKHVGYEYLPFELLVNSILE